ncbi:MAG: hypothetical protein ACXAEN_23120 [Candidatus Thorarchaeota archaeon]|jgi:hypothetical protein
MGAWKLVEGLSLDLSGMSHNDLDTVLKNLESGDVEEILADLKKEKEKIEVLNKSVELAFRIAELVLTKGISLA